MTRVVNLEMEYISTTNNVSIHYHSALKYFEHGQFLKGMADLTALIAIDRDYLNKHAFRRAIAAFLSVPQTSEDLQEFIKIVMQPVYWHAVFTKFLTDVTLAKQQLLAAIFAISDPKQQKELLWQALSKDTLVGKLFFVPRGWFPTSYNRGTLNQVATRLKGIIEEEGNASPKSPEVLPPKLQDSLLRDGNLQYYFPRLAAKVRTMQTNHDHFHYHHPAPPLSYFYKPRGYEQTNINGFLSDNPPRGYMHRRHSG